MSNGLNITGSHGGTLIDQNYRNIARIAQGSSNATSTTIQIPDQGGIFPLVYARPWADGHFVGGMYFNNNTITLTTNRFVRTSAGTVQFTGNVGFDYVIFGVNGIQLLDSTSQGLKVWDQNGSVVFDSRCEQPRLRTVLNITQTGNYTNITYPKTYGFTGWGKRPWISMNAFSYYYISDESDNGFFVTTSGTNAIIVRQAEMSPSATSALDIKWVENQFSGLVSNFPLNRSDIGLIERYTD